MVPERVWRKERSRGAGANGEVSGKGGARLVLEEELKSWEKETGFYCITAIQVTHTFSLVTYSFLTSLPLSKS